MTHFIKVGNVGFCWILNAPALPLAFQACIKTYSGGAGGGAVGWWWWGSGVQGILPSTVLPFAPSWFFFFFVLNNKYDPPIYEILVLEHVSPHHQTLFLLHSFFLCRFFIYSSLSSSQIHAVFWNYVKHGRCSMEVVTFWAPVTEQHGSSVEADPRLLAIHRYG